MTENKAQKAAIRARMAATGEPYSVARHAVLGGQPPRPAGPPVPGPKPWDERSLGPKPWDEQIPADRPWDERVRDEAFWNERYYADGAATEGISVEEFRAREFADMAGEHAEWNWEFAGFEPEQAEGEADWRYPPGPGPSRLPRPPRVPRPPRPPRRPRLPRLLGMAFDPWSQPPWWPARSETRPAGPPPPPD